MHFWVRFSLHFLFACVFPLFCWELLFKLNVAAFHVSWSVRFALRSVLHFCWCCSFSLSLALLHTYRPSSLFVVQFAMLFNKILGIEKLETYWCERALHCVCVLFFGILVGSSISVLCGILADSKYIKVMDEIQQCSAGKRKSVKMRRFKNGTNPLWICYISNMLCEITSEQCVVSPLLQHCFAKTRIRHFLYAFKMLANEKGTTEKKNTHTQVFLSMSIWGFTPVQVNLHLNKAVRMGTAAIRVEISLNFGMLEIIGNLPNNPTTRSGGKPFDILKLNRLY